MDVMNECEKHGEILHCFVDTNSNGNVYLMFANLDSCRKAAQDMNGRWFNRREIQVTYVRIIIIIIFHSTYQLDLSLWENMSLVSLIPAELPRLLRQIWPTQSKLLFLKPAM